MESLGFRGVFLVVFSCLVLFFPQIKDENKKAFLFPGRKGLVLCVKDQMLQFSVGSNKIIVATTVVSCVPWK